MDISSVDISVVVPIYNEEETLHELYTRLIAVMNKFTRNNETIKFNSINKSASTASSTSMDGIRYEIIMVDDGSTDESWRIIKELHDNDPKIKGISFSRNFGHHIAISAGLDCAKGAAVFVMDGDLQDPPEEMPKLYEKLSQGYDLVYGVRIERRDNLYRRLVSSLFWSIIRKLSGFDIPKNQSMLRVMSRKYVDNFNKFSERNRFLAGLFAWTGFKQVSVMIEHAPRFAGRSKYNTWKMIKLTFHAVTSFSYFPLQMAGLAGLFIAGASFLLGLWFIVKKIFFGVNAVGWASTMVTILFIGGVQLAVLGLIGEYIGRVFIEVQQRPLYIINDRRGL